jgi:hypothetical protein
VRNPCNHCAVSRAKLRQTFCPNNMFAKKHARTACCCEVHTLVHHLNYVGHRAQIWCIRWGKSGCWVVLQRDALMNCRQAFNNVSNVILCIKFLCTRTQAPCSPDSKYSNAPRNPCPSLGGTCIASHITQNKGTNNGTLMM